MKRRKSKKMYAPGTLVAIQGTSCVFMSLGIRNENQLDSFNGIDLSTGKAVRRCDGIARPATRKESEKYWTCIKALAKENGKEI